eukprot:237865_1
MKFMLCSIYLFLVWIQIVSPTNRKDNLRRLLHPKITQTEKIIYRDYLRQIRKDQIHQKINTNIGEVPTKYFGASKRIMLTLQRNEKDLFHEMISFGIDNWRNNKFFVDGNIWKWMRMFRSLLPQINMFIFSTSLLTIILA